MQDVYILYRMPVFIFVAYQIARFEYGMIPGYLDENRLKTLTRVNSELP